ncbi:hypothetical protein ACIBJI_07325 [Nocardia sp. NPDC050408]|uniref:hypothetical protein n=1 Tax=Nocardia sp. NPDC050408 TaxID=3364319 RepID=UPI0037A3AB6E
MIRRTLAAGIAVAIVSVALAGCTTAPDGRPQADRLRDELGAMPGVENISVDYSNDFTRGTYLDLDLSMRAASEAQVAEVVDRINTIKQRDFDSYQQSTEIIVGDRLELKLGAELDPHRIAARTHELRQLDTSLPGAAITWTTSGFEIEKSPPTTDSLAAVRTVLGNDPTQVTIRPADRQPVWTVDLPFGTQQEQDIQTLLTGLPIPVTFVRIINGHIANLSVGVHSPDTAYQDLTAVIAETRPTPDHPMDLRWNWGSYSPDKQFTGSVQVAGCSDQTTAADAHPEHYLTPEAIALQRRLRTEFETCN